MKLSFLFFSCLSLIAVAAPEAPELDRSLLSAGNINLRVEQGDVPTNSRASRIKVLNVNLKKIGGTANGEVTLKAYFVGKDAETSELVLNAVGSQAAEAVGGAGNTYIFQSNVFKYTPSKSADGKKKETPAKGIQPQGWVVRVYEKDKLLVTACSTQGYDGLIAREEANVPTTKSPNCKAKEKIAAK